MAKALQPTERFYTIG